MNKPDTNAIRVMLVDDSQLTLNILSKRLNQYPDLEVVATAHDGGEALPLVANVKPDIVCTDLHMKGMDGLEFTRRVMSTTPVPILVVTVSAIPNDQSRVFQLLKAGAIDIMQKPSGGFSPDSRQAIDSLARRIRIVAGVTPFQRFHGRPPSTETSRPQAPPQLIAIGASTGGPVALQGLLSALPAAFPVPILIAQHISAGFLGGLIEWLAPHVSVRCAIAHHGQRISAGEILFAPDGARCQIDAYMRIQIETGTSRLSRTIDPLLESCADALGSHSAGILLTGMGDDGSQGLNRIRRAGGWTAVQDSESCLVSGMPYSALRLNPGHTVGTPTELAAALTSIADNTRGDGANDHEPT
ncbi:MAG: chemotaxis protein CheB [Gammaproteobacteria bacterium]